MLLIGFLLLFKCDFMIDLWSGHTIPTLVVKSPHNFVIIMKACISVLLIASSEPFPDHAIIQPITITRSQPCWSTCWFGMVVVNKKHESSLQNLIDSLPLWFYCICTSEKPEIDSNCFQKSVIIPSPTFPKPAVCPEAERSNTSSSAASFTYWSNIWDELIPELYLQ